MIAPQQVCTLSDLEYRNPGGAVCRPVASLLWVFSHRFRILTTSPPGGKGDETPTSHETTWGPAPEKEGQAVYNYSHLSFRLPAQAYEGGLGRLRSDVAKFRHVVLGTYLLP